MIKFQNTFSQHILWQIAKKWHAFRIYMVQLTWCKLTCDKLWRCTCFSCIYIAQILNQTIKNANKFFHAIFELFAAVYMRILFCWVMKLLHRVNGWGSTSLLIRLYHGAKKKSVLCKELQTFSLTVCIQIYWKQQQPCISTHSLMALLIVTAVNIGRVIATGTLWECQFCRKTIKENISSNMLESSTFPQTEEMKVWWKETCPF
jgi:hypothetical protein